MVWHWVSRNLVTPCDWGTIYRNRTCRLPVLVESYSTSHASHASPCHAKRGFWGSTSWRSEQSTNLSTQQSVQERPSGASPPVIGQWTDELKINNNKFRHGIACEMASGRAEWQPFSMLGWRMSTPRLTRGNQPQQFSRNWRARTSQSTSEGCYKPRWAPLSNYFWNQRRDERRMANVHEALSREFGREGHWRLSETS